MCRSVPQMPQAPTRMISSSGLGVGSGTLPTRTLPGLSMIAARIVIPPYNAQLRAPTMQIGLAIGQYLCLDALALANHVQRIGKVLQRKSRGEQGFGVYHATADEIKRSEEHTSELQSPCNLVCRLLLEKK